MFEVQAGDERIDFNYLSQLIVAPVNYPWNRMTNVELIIGNEKIKQQKTIFSLHNLVPSVTWRMLRLQTVADPGFPRRGSTSPKGGSKLIIWPKLYKNEKIGPRGQVCVPCAPWIRQLQRLCSTKDDPQVFRSTVADPRFPKGDANSKGKCANLLFDQFFLKTAWKWKKLDQGEACALGSPNSKDFPQLKTTLKFFR